VRKLVSAEDGKLKIDGILIPGIFEGCDISGDLRIDEQDIPGSSAKSKQPMGFQDAQITFRLRLVTDDQYTCYDRLNLITRIFRSVNKSARPYVRRIVNKNCASWGISEVLFKQLSSSDNNTSKDTLSISITFVEWQPTVVKKEQAVKNPMTEFSWYQQDSTTIKYPDTPAIDDRGLTI
jgi:hypothetical protein